MRTNATTNSTGGGLSGTIFIVFLVLKLTDYIDWSWWWVTSPLWIPLVLLLVAGLVTILVIGIKDLLN